MIMPEEIEEENAIGSSIKEGKKENNFFQVEIGQKNCCNSFGRRNNFEDKDLIMQPKKGLYLCDNNKP